MQMKLPLQGDETAASKEEPQLPAAFDDSCKRCGTQMERVRVHYCTDVKPFATFQCLECKLRLFLIEVPCDTPLLLWSSQTVLRSTRFSAFVAETLEKRNHERDIRRLRYGA